MIRIITLLIFALFFFITSIFAQNTSISHSSSHTGDWYGQLDIQGTKLKINFHVIKKDGIYITTMDSPDQGAMGILTTKTVIDNDSIEVVLENMNVNFRGQLKEDIIDGIFKQNGMEIPLVLLRTKIVSEKQKARYQDPQKPYNYISEDVFFVNEKANNIKLAGTLTLPKGIKNPPVAILISGSGPQNRDEEIKIFNHRPFLVLSDYLTNNGVAVLRYDDRGVAESEGQQNGATSADFATDVEAAVAYLKTRNDINTNKIGLIGHSEGGFIAPMVASKNNHIAFIVLLAGTGVDGGEVLKAQAKRGLELAGLSKEHILFNDKMSNYTYNLIRTESDIKKLKEKVTTYLKEVKKNAPESIKKELTNDAIESQIKMITSPWISYFIKTNPNQFLSKTHCPVLALNGEKDFQVLPKLNLNGIENSLKKAKNKDVTIHELEGLNHLFQTCETGALNEYSQIEETFSPKALKIISDWINKRF